MVFSLICRSINGWVSNREAGDLRRHRAHYDGTVMYCRLFDIVGGSSFLRYIVQNRPMFWSICFGPEASIWVTMRQTCEICVKYAPDYHNKTWQNRHRMHNSSGPLHSPINHSMSNHLITLHRFTLYIRIQLQWRHNSLDMSHLTGPSIVCS